MWLDKCSGPAFFLIDRSIKLRPIAYWPIPAQRRSIKYGPTCVRVSLGARQNCAERHWRGARVLAQTCVVGGAYWIGLLSKARFILPANAIRMFTSQIPANIAAKTELWGQIHIAFAFTFEVWTGLYNTSLCIIFKQVCWNVDFESYKCLFSSVE